MHSRNLMVLAALAASACAPGLTLQPDERPRSTAGRMLLLDAAERLADELPEPHFRVRAHAELAAGFAQLGQPTRAQLAVERAFRLAGELTADDRAPLLPFLADGAAAIGRCTQLRELEARPDEFPSEPEMPPIEDEWEDSEEIRAGAREYEEQTQLHGYRRTLYGAAARSCARIFDLEGLASLLPALARYGSAPTFEDLLVAALRAGRGRSVDQLERLAEVLYASKMPFDLRRVALARIGGTLDAMGRSTQAMKLLERAWLGPPPEETYRSDFVLAFAEYAVRLDETTKLARYVREPPHQEDAQAMFAKALLGAGREADAREVLRQLEGQCPRSIEVGRRWAEMGLAATVVEALEACVRQGGRAWFTVVEWVTDPIFAEAVPLAQRRRMHRQVVAGTQRLAHGVASRHEEAHMALLADRREPAWAEGGIWKRTSWPDAPARMVEVAARVVGKEARADLLLAAARRLLERGDRSGVWQLITQVESLVGPPGEVESQVGRWHRVRLIELIADAGDPARALRLASRPWRAEERPRLLYRLALRRWRDIPERRPALEKALNAFLIAAARPQPLPWACHRVRTCAAVLNREGPPELREWAAKTARQPATRGTPQASSLVCKDQLSEVNRHGALAGRPKLAEACGRYR